MFYQIYFKKLNEYFLLIKNRRVPFVVKRGVLISSLILMCVCKELILMVFYQNIFNVVSYDYFIQNYELLKFILVPSL